MKQGSKNTESTTDQEYPSEELYRVLFERAADGIFIVDTQREYIEVNPRGCEMLGYTRAEIQKKYIPDLFPDEGMKATFLNLNALEAGHAIIQEGQLLRKDGSTLPVEIIGQKLKDGRWVGIVHDLSERKPVKEELLQLARFPAENPNPIIRVSKQGKILYANEASMDLLEEWNAEVGGMLPSAWKKTTSRLADKRVGQNVEVPCKGRIYAMTITPVPGTDYVNLYGSDITEIKHSEEALRRAEEKYRNIFEQSQDGIFQSTPTGRFITVNPALARIWGYESPEEVIENITNIARQIYVIPEERQKFLHLMNEHKEVEDFEFRAYRKDGSIIWVQENIRTVRDADGNVQYYEGTVKDITEQKHTLEALRRSEERYRSTLNNMMEGCQIIDFEWRYIYVNDTAALHGRRKPEEMLMRSMMELYPGIEETELFSFLRNCMENRTEKRIENEFTFPDGEKGWFELSVQPVPEGLFILSVDISERKQAERKLKDREARYRTLFENLPVPVFTKDREGRYTSCNAEELKYWAENPIGHFDEDLLPSDIARDLRKADLQVMESGEPLIGEEKFQAPFGLRYELVRKVPLRDGSGNVIGVMGAGLDITERRRAEEKLREAEQFNQSTIDALTAHICVLDENGVILSVNRAWHEFAEANPPVPSDHFVGENYLAVCDAAQGENAKEAAAFATGLRSVLQNEREQFKLEYPCNVPGGEKRWFIGRITHFTLGETVRVVVAHENISERKLFELALQDSEEHFRSLYENAAIGIYRTNPDGRILMVNPAALRMLGYETFDDLAQRNLEQAGYEPSYSRSKFREQIEKKDVITGLESAWTRKDGSVIYVRESARAIRDEHGNVKYYDGTFEDITVQKWAEQALRASEARFSTVFHASPVSIAITRLKDNVFVDVNDAWLKQTGFSGDEAVGRDAHELNLWPVPEQRVELMKQLQKQGRVQGKEIQIRKNSGEILDILFYAETIELSGEAHMLSTGLDISDRKRAEEKIQQQLTFQAALNNIDHMITSSSDLHQTLNVVAKHVSAQLQLDAVHILLADPKAIILEHAVEVGFLGNAHETLRLPVGEDYAGKIVKERRMLQISDLRQTVPPSSQTYLTEKENFVAYIGLPLIAKKQIKGVLEVFHRAPLEMNEEQITYLKAFAEQAAIAIDNAQLFENLQQTNTELTLAYDATIEGWSYALDLRDKETEGHTLRVTEITTRLCERFGLNEDEIRCARWGALLHDIGKMGIPDAILQKPGKLSDEEWVMMKKHPVFARNMLERINYLKSAIDIPYCHHEKWDGSGYPRGLKGEEIPLAARIFAIADVWDALTSDRPYRPAWSKKDTLEYIKSIAGSHLDAQVVKVFLELEYLWKDTEK